MGYIGLMHRVSVEKLLYVLEVDDSKKYLRAFWKRTVATTDSDTALSTYRNAERDLIAQEQQSIMPARDVSFGIRARNATSL